MRKRIKVPGIVTIMALTLITTILWVGFEVVRIVISKPEPDVPPQVLESLNPTLDTLLLDKLEKRVYLNEDELNVFKPQPKPTPEPPTTEEQENTEVS